MKFVPRIWSARISLPKKIQATLHLTGYGIHVLMSALASLFPILAILPERYPKYAPLFGFALLFNLTTFAPLLLAAVAQQQLGRRWWQALPSIFLLTTLGAGMMLNTTRAALQILFHKTGVFERTPKFGISDKSQAWLQRRYQLHLDSIVIFELGFALFNLATTSIAIAERNWLIAAYALLVSTGLLFTSVVTILQTVAVNLYRPRVMPSAQSAGA